MLACSGKNNEELRTENEAVPAARICIILSDKQKYVEQFDTFPISTVGRDHRARRDLPHYRQDA